MNTLKPAKQETVIRALVEGCSIRSTERMTGVHRDTIIRLVGRVGAGCEALMHQTMRNLPCDKIQMDEIWGYVGKKQRHLTEQDDPTQVGDKWVFVAIDADSKLVPSYRVGQRTLTRGLREKIASDARNGCAEVLAQPTLYRPIWGRRPTNRVRLTACVVAKLSQSSSYVPWIEFEGGVWTRE